LREDPLTARGDIEDRSWGFGLAVGTDGAYGWDGGLGPSFLFSPAPGPTVIALTPRMWDSPDPPAVHREIRDAAIRSCSQGRSSTSAQIVGVSPPSTTSLAPVTADARGDARKQIQLATSSGEMNRPSGVLAAVASATSLAL
jgi:hypothetical protein